MAEPPRPEQEGSGASPDQAGTISSPHRRPRWVTVTGIVVGLLVLVFVILNLAGLGPGDGGHGPGMHGGAGVTTHAGQSPPP